MASLNKPLNSIMEFDLVIQVHADETVTVAPDVQAPELHTEPTEGGGAEEYLDSPHGTSWELLSGYTGQYGYNGPIMHPSEFIGGRMECDILARPGYYVALVADDPDDNIDEPMGWAVAYRPMEESYSSGERKALLAFVDTIEATGGVTHNVRGELAPVVDEDWVDLGHAYVEACAALNRTTKIATPEA